MNRKLWRKLYVYRLALDHLPRWQNRTTGVFFSLLCYSYAAPVQEGVIEDTLSGLAGLTRVSDLGDLWDDLVKIHQSEDVTVEIKDGSEWKACLRMSARPQAHDTIRYTNLMALRDREERIQEAQKKASQRSKTAKTCPPAVPHLSGGQGGDKGHCPPNVPPLSGGQGGDKPTEEKSIGERERESPLPPCGRKGLLTLAERLGIMFGKRGEYVLPRKVAEAWSAVSPTDEEMDALEWYYVQEGPEELVRFRSGSPAALAESFKAQLARAQEWRERTEGAKEEGGDGGREVAVEVPHGDVELE
jgi:hypothetical protein